MITINEQSSVRLSFTKNIYIDPFHLEEELHDADIIFITHSHYDHFSLEDIEKCRNENTVIVSVGDTYGKLSRIFDSSHLILVKPEEEFQVLGIPVKIVPAYNLDKQYHLKEYQWVGYILTIEDQTYYFMGDTDCLDFMKDIHPDYLFIPIGGKFTMTMEEAALLVNEMKPKVVIPIHYGTIIGEASLGSDFSKKIDSDIDCRLLLKFSK